MLDAGLGAGLQQVARGAGVVAVVLERIGDGLWNDCVGREVHDRRDVVVAQEATDELTISGVSDDQRAVQYGRAESGRQIVQNHDVFAALAELTNDMTTDIPGTAGNQNGHS